MLSRAMAAAAAVLLSSCLIGVGMIGGATRAAAAASMQGQDQAAPAQVSQAKPAAVPEAGAFISRLAQDAVAQLSDKSMALDVRLQRFRELLAAGFDVPAVARFVLGRYWRVATPQEREEYVKLFQDYVVSIYASRFQQYNGETLQVNGAVRDDDGAVVSSLIVRPSGPPVKVDWKLRREEPGFKIVDVMVEGVSMSVTQRDDFAAAIQAHGGKVAGLIDLLKQKVQTAQK